MDSTHMAGDYFNPENSKTTLELAARYEELKAIATHSDYKKDEITDSTVIYSNHECWFVIYHSCGQGVPYQYACKRQCPV